MSDGFVRMVYDTLQGTLIEEARIPGVENLFTEGTPCERMYSEVLDAYGRLCCRLGVQDDDQDVEIIINALLSICEEVGFAMYRCGARFGCADNV